jgi:hypothetical protein
VYAEVALALGLLPHVRGPAPATPRASELAAQTVR